MKNNRLLAGASESIVITGIPAATALSMLSFKQRWVRDRDQNAGGFLLHGLVHRVALGLGIVILRSDEVGSHFETATPQ